jgi:hypothetical protein
LNLRYVLDSMLPHRMRGSLPFTPLGGPSASGSTTVHTAIGTRVHSPRPAVTVASRRVRKALRFGLVRNLRAAVVAEGLVEIGHEVARVFESAGDPDHAVHYAAASAFLGSHAVMGGGNRLGHGALDAAKACSDAEDLKLVHHRGGLESVAVVDKAEYPPEAAHLPAGHPGSAGL